MMRISETTESEAFVWISVSTKTDLKGWPGAGPF